MLTDKSSDRIAAVTGSGIITRPLSLRPVVALAPAVKEVDNGVALPCSLVIVGRQKDPEVPLFGEDLAIEVQVEDAGLRTAGDLRRDGRARAKNLSHNK